MRISPTPRSRPRRRCEGGSRSRCGSREAHSMTRTYDSPVRRQQAEATREKIVAAGTELLHGFAVWNWRALTVRAVAERAGVNERTVYRYFANERELRDAVLERLERDSGIALDGLELDDIQEHTRRILAYVSTFP